MRSYMRWLVANLLPLEWAPYQSDHLSHLCRLGFVGSLRCLDRCNGGLGVCVDNLEICKDLAFRPSETSGRAAFSTSAARRQLGRCHNSLHYVVWKRVCCSSKGFR